MSNDVSVFNGSISDFESAQRMAQALAVSDFVPESYKPKPGEGAGKAIGNILIALDISRRMGANVLMVMQNLYVVYGRPAWSSVFMIGCFNATGRFSPITYEFSGEPGKDDYGCRAVSCDLKTGERIEGTFISWAMVRSEKWCDKPGSKWKTMPEQMFRYRAAAFLIRATAPEILLGLHTADEIEDIQKPKIEPIIGSSHKTIKLNEIDKETTVKESLTDVDKISIDADESNAEFIKQLGD